MFNKVFVAFVIGGSAAVLVGVLAYEHASFPYLVAVSALMSAIVGWQWASRQNVRRAVELIHESGGIEAALDRSGREMLTLWIPLDHHITEADRQHGKELGKAFARDVSRHIAGYSALETSLDKVGVMFIGRDADVMLQEIRRYFSSRCPRGSYITRRRLPRTDESQDFQFDLWPGGRPLFEDDVLPQTGITEE